MSGGAAAHERTQGIAAPSVIRVEQRVAAVIRITVARADMPSVMGPAIRELRQALRTQGIPAGGAVFAHHFRMDAAVFDFAVGITTEQPVAAVGRVRVGSLPQGPLARTIYSGGYEGLSAAWGALHRWMQDNGHDRSTDLWEVYTAGPDTSANPADWRTELNQPVRRSAAGPGTAAGPSSAGDDTFAPSLVC